MQYKVIQRRSIDYSSSWRNNLLSIFFQSLGFFKNSFQHGPPRCIQIAFSIAHWFHEIYKGIEFCARIADRCKNAFTRSGFERGTRATNVQQVIFSPAPGEVTVIGGRRSNTRKIYQRSVHQIRSRFARALSPN